MPAVTKIVKSGVSQDEIDRIIKFKKEVYSIVPFELKEGDRITADMLANKLKEYSTPEYRAKELQKANEIAKLMPQVVGGEV